MAWVKSGYNWVNTEIDAYMSDADYRSKILGEAPRAPGSGLDFDQWFNKFIAPGLSYETSVAQPTKEDYQPQYQQYLQKMAGLPSDMWTPEYGGGYDTGLASQTGYVNPITGERADALPEGARVFDDLGYNSQYWNERYPPETTHWLQVVAENPVLHKLQDGDFRQMLSRYKGWNDPNDWARLQSMFGIDQNQGGLWGGSPSEWLGLTVARMQDEEDSAQAQSDIHALSVLAAPLLFGAGSAAYSAAGGGTLGGAAAGATVGGITGGTQSLLEGSNVAEGALGGAAVGGATGAAGSYLADLAGLTPANGAPTTGDTWTGYPTTGDMPSAFLDPANFYGYQGYLGNPENTGTAPIPADPTTGSEFPEYVAPDVPLENPVTDFLGVDPTTGQPLPPEVLNAPPPTGGPGTTSPLTNAIGATTGAAALGDLLGGGSPDANSPGGGAPSDSVLGDLWNYLNGTGTGSNMNWTQLLGILGSTGLGVYGANQQANALEGIAAREDARIREMMGYGAPYRSKLSELYANPSSYLTSDEVRIPVEQGTNALARSLSTTGNPAGNPAAMQAIQNYATNTLYGKLGQEKDRLAGYGGLTAYNAAAAQGPNLGPSLGAINAQGNVYNAIGSGLADLTAPRRTSLSDLLKMSLT